MIALSCIATAIIVELKVVHCGGAAVGVRPHLEAQGGAGGTGATGGTPASMVKVLSDGI